MLIVRAAASSNMHALMTMEYSTKDEWEKVALRLLEEETAAHAKYWTSLTSRKDRPDLVQILAQGHVTYLKSNELTILRLWRSKWNAQVVQESAVQAQRGAPELDVKK